MLRQILGPYDGQEDIFAATVECSVSWVKKVSAGFRPVTPQTARMVSMATGVSEGWLLEGDPKAPILERDGVTSYTRESYERWRRDNIGSSGEAPISGLKHEESAIAATLDPQSVATLTAEMLKAVFAAMEAGKGNLAVNDLWKHAKVMKRRYGSPSEGENPEAFLGLVGNLVTEAGRSETRRR